MVSIIKNQLLKHLSRFTKNLSADKINLSTFKGEGELSNLELDEIVLTDLLELPSWLRLTSAWCNKVAFRIQWTKLKSVPIFLSLDEVYIKVETCEELRSLSMQHGLSSYTGQGKYSFINKVIDGMSIAVNTVCVTFESPAFTASVQISRILVESRTPKWEKGDLRVTRVKEVGRGQILIFKELQWQTVRIEAKSTKDENLSPLRLLTNQAHCRITIKKRLSDCFIVGSRLVLILDDLLWVLTDSQLKAALCFVDSLTGLIQKSTELTRTKKAARKLEELPEYQAQMSQQARSRDAAEASSTRIFNRYDVVETSYHFLSKRIDLHLCDDAGGGRSVHPDLKDGAALQISLERFQIDYYPYHLAIGDRKHWPVYRETASPHSQWLKQALTSFRTSLLDLIEPVRSQHAPLGRSNVASPPSSAGEKQTTPQAEHMQKRPTLPQPTGNPLKNYLLSQLAKLMTSCVILRVQDFSLYQITTNKRKQMPKEFVTGDRIRYNLPVEEMILHAEFTYYYYPGDIGFPLPPPKFYVQINPVQVRFDVCSCLWLNAFLLNLHHSLMATKPQQPAAMPYIDVKIEAIMPRIIFDCSVDHPNQKDRPKSLHVEVSRASVTNVRTLEHSSRADLAKCVDTFQLGSLFYGADFPAVFSDYNVVTEKFFQHLRGTDNIRSPPQVVASSIPEMEQKLSRELLWTESKDMWCICLEPVWAEFYGTPAVGGNKPVSFLDAVPLTLWVHLKFSEPVEKDDKVQHELLKRTSPQSGRLLPQSLGHVNEKDPCSRVADIHVLAYVSNLVSVQINHYQYLFLLRLSEEANELTTILAIDTKRIINAPNHNPSLVVGAMVPQVEVTFVMPSQSPGKECSGGDLESVFPDSASLQEDNATASVPSIPYATKHIELQTPEEPIRYQMGGEIELPRGQGIGENALASTNIFPNNFNTGLTSMKKGFSSIMNTLDSALKSSPDDASDTTSLRSGDDSSDSEKYVFLDHSSDIGDKLLGGVDSMFSVAGNVVEPLQPLEVACEVVEEEATTTSPSERSMDSSSKRRDLVSMSTFKLGQVEFVQQSEGFTSVIKVQVSRVAAEECSSIPWDELQNKFDCRSRAWNEIPVDGGCRPQVTARLTHTVVPGELLNRMSLKNWTSDKLEARVQDMDLELNMSSVVGLADLFEDEIIPDPLPMQIALDNMKLHLNEDRPPSNITSPGPIPVDLALSKLCIHRGKDGVFYFEPQTATAMESAVSPFESNGSVQRVEALEEINRQLLIENRELKRRLAALERVSEENHLLRQSSEESQVLRSCLAVAQDDVAHLLEEKRSLLDRLKGLQDQLDQSHRSKR
ncbi:hypothetical protein R5R35_009669 [Gryllus longicercus]|uniref:UHRF1-binding protein 1-like n=1 Tax=Gryllus longicercus TaxID=2509291 RepID=A0AAN9VAD5_9ORTH